MTGLRVYPGTCHRKSFTTAFPAWHAWRVAKSRAPAPKLGEWHKSPKHSTSPICEMGMILQVAHGVGVRGAWDTLGTCQCLAGMDSVCCITVSSSLSTGWAHRVLWCFAARAQPCSCPGIFPPQRCNPSLTVNSVYLIRLACVCLFLCSCLRHGACHLLSLYKAQNQFSYWGSHHVRFGVFIWFLVSPFVLISHSSPSFFPPVKIMYHPPI